MGGMSGFVEGLMKSLGPGLEEARAQRQKERDFNHATAWRAITELAPNDPNDKGSKQYQDALKNFTETYGDKGPKIAQLLGPIFGKIRQAHQQGQGKQQTGPVQPPASPQQSASADAAMGPEGVQQEQPSGPMPSPAGMMQGQKPSRGQKEYSKYDTLARGVRAGESASDERDKASRKFITDEQIRLDDAKEANRIKTEAEKAKSRGAKSLQRTETYDPTDNKLHSYLNFMEPDGSVTSVDMGAKVDPKEMENLKQTGRSSLLTQKGKQSSDLQASRPPTGYANKLATLTHAHEVLNRMDSTPAEIAAAKQVVEQNQQNMKTVAGTVDPLTGEKGPSYQVPSKQPLQSGANPATPQPQRQPAANQPRQPAQTQRIPTVSDSGEKMYQNSPSTGQKFSTPQPFRAKTISNSSLSNYGLMPVQFAQGETTVLPTSQKGAALLNDMAESTKLILRDIESGTKPGAAIKNASSKAMGRGPGYAKALLSYLNNQGFLEVINTPTTAAKGLADQSRNMLPHVDEIENKIRELDKKGKLGPSMGRFNNFLTKKWGSADPEYAELQSLLGFFTTGMMRAHVGARGGVQIMDTFKEKWDSGKMDAPTLIAGLEGARSFLNTYAKSDKIENPGGANRVQPPSTKPPLSSFERN